MSLTVLAMPLLVAMAPAAEVQPSLADPVAPVVSSETPAPPSATVSAPAADAPTDVSVGNEIVVSGHPPSPADPVEQLNVVSYAVVQGVDKAVIAPIAHGYEKGVPKPVRDGLHNVLNNLDEPIVFINFLLQLKPVKALETLGRMTINTTVGVGGLFDVAKKKPFNLPRRSNGLADTLAYYGVGPGPYLFLPLIGATTLRDVIARPFDLMVLPAVLPKPFADPKVSLAKGVLSALDERQQDDGRLRRIHESADPYLVQREEYLARRRAEIEVLKGKRKSIDDPPYYIYPDEKAAKAESARAAAAPTPVDAPAASPMAPQTSAQPVQPGEAARP